MNDSKVLWQWDIAHRLYNELYKSPQDCKEKKENNTALKGCQKTIRCTFTEHLKTSLIEQNEKQEVF